MEVLFLRHAHAVDGFGCKDEYRWLSDRGREEAAGFGQRLRDRGWQPTRVWTSPKARAVQTTELVLRFMDMPTSCVAHVLADLAYGTTAKALGCLDGMRDEERILLVGHEPLIRTMASHFAQADLRAFSTASGALVATGERAQMTYELVG